MRKRVSRKDFHKYDKLHTEKVRMYSGVEMTTLYPIKETSKFYISIGVWSYCATEFKRKKEGFNLEVNIPILTDERAIGFLNEHCWEDWVERRNSGENSEVAETLALLKNLFPDKKAVFIYELEQLLADYNHGAFISYDDEGNVQPVGERDLERQQRYKKRYSDYPLEAFIKIGEAAVCYPVAFSHNTAEWSREKYGKLIAYAEAGDIYFVATPDTVYFEVGRHF